MALSTITELLTLLHPNLVWWYSIIILNVLWKIGLLCSRSRSQQRFKMSVSICQDNIFWTIKVPVKAHIIKIWLSIISSELLILLLPYQVWWCTIINLSVLWKDWIALFSVFWTISSELLDVSPNLVQWCIIKDQSVMQKNWFAITIYMAKVALRVHGFRCDCFYHVHWTAYPFATKFMVDTSS